MKIQNGHYVSESGKRTLLGDMTYPHLLNAYEKAKKLGDFDTVTELEVEIQKRPQPEN